MKLGSAPGAACLVWGGVLVVAGAAVSEFGDGAAAVSLWAGGV